MKRKRTLSVLCLCVLSVQLWGQEAGTGPRVTGGATTQASNTNDDLQALRERIEKQEEAIKKLQESVEEQRVLLERAVQNAQQGTQSAVASASAGSSNASPDLIPVVSAGRPDLAANARAAQKNETAPSPLAISIGNTTFSPLGFVDATFYARSSNVGSGIGTNFGGIPYNTSAGDHLSETSFSTQNSRIGFRVDSNVLGAKVLGYFEADFLGNQPANVFVTSNSDTFRMRNIFVDVQRNGFEVLAGQDWSFATPNRKGLSPLPSDIFYTQNMDTNYQAGLVWSRQTQFRFIAHPSENVAFGVSLENPQQYNGGSGGLSAAAVTYPFALTPTLLGQINNGASSVNVTNAAGVTTALTGGGNYSTPNLHPDIIFKAAFDGHAGNDQAMHIEVGGMVRSFKDVIPLGTPVTFTTNSATAGSGFVNANLEVVKNLRIIANTFFGSGNGRYVFGLAPDFIVRQNGSISPIHTYSTVDGFELTIHKSTLFDAYYGGIYVGRNVAFDLSNPKPGFVGYGFAGSGANDNRTIQEGTLGLTQTFWKNPNYGALSLITQYSYLSRNPWAVSTTAPRSTHTNMVWVDLRYTLP